MALRLYLQVQKAPRRADEKPAADPDHARGTLLERKPLTGEQSDKLTTEQEIVLDDESFDELLIQEERGRETALGQEKNTESAKIHRLDGGIVLNNRHDPVADTIPPKRAPAKTPPPAVSGKMSEPKHITSHHVKPFAPNENISRDSRQFKEMRAEHLISEFDLILKKLATSHGNADSGYDFDAKTLLSNSAIDSAELLETTDLNELASLAVQRLNKLLSEDENVRLVFQTVEQRKRTGTPPPTIPLNTARQVAALTMISRFAIDADRITRDIAKNQK